METHSQSGINSYVIYLAFIATLGPLQFGYHLGELNAPQKVITCTAENASSVLGLLPLPQYIPMGPSTWAMIQSVFTIGGFCGSLIGGHLATEHGRIFATRAMTVPLLVGSLCEAGAPNVFVMGLGRFISGIGAGAATVIGPIYIAEIAPVDKRGLFGAFTQVMVNFGILLGQLLGYFLSTASLWRVILVVPGLIAVSQSFGLIFAPETPKWLVENNQTYRAKQNLRKIRGPAFDIMPEMAHWHVSNTAEEQTLLGPSSNLQAENRPSMSVVDAIKNPRYRKAVIAISAVMMAQQLSGINSVVMYSVEVLGSIVPSAAALVTVIASGTNVIITATCAPLADKIGRKRCLLLSIGGVGCNAALLAVGLQCDSPILSVVATILFVCSFGVGLGSVPFILSSELVGAEAVGAVSGIALALNWASTFCVAQFFPMLDAALPRGQVYWIFAAIAAVFALIISCRLPESKGLSKPEDVWAAFEGPLEKCEEEIA